jgi:hypothetical protein
VTELLGWLIIFGLIGLGWAGGWLCTREHLRDEHQALKRQAEALQTQWESLRRSQELNTAFWDARQAMRHEALRQQHIVRGEWQ